MRRFFIQSNLSPKIEVEIIKSRFYPTTLLNLYC